MKILHNGQAEREAWPLKAECPYCRCSFEYSKEDLGSETQFRHRRWVQCPSCQRSILVKDRPASGPFEPDCTGPDKSSWPPCPFCGTNEHLVVESNICSGHRYGFAVCCKEGCCIGPLGTTMEAAIEVWGRRVAASQQPT